MKADDVRAPEQVVELDTTGRVITSAIIQVAAFVAFVLYIRRRVGVAGGYAAMALLATYPGTYYWAGLPYCHAMIVPASLAGMMILCELERDDLHLRRAAWRARCSGERPACRLKAVEKAKALRPLLHQLRTLAMEQPGYISGETLMNGDNPEEHLVISSWTSADCWQSWFENEERKAVQEKIDELLGRPTLYQVYYHT